MTSTRVPKKVSHTETQNWWLKLVGGQNKKHVFILFI